MYKPSWSWGQAYSFLNSAMLSLFSEVMLKKGVEVAIHIYYCQSANLLFRFHLQTIAFSPLNSANHKFLSEVMLPNLLNIYYTIKAILLEVILSYFYIYNTKSNLICWTLFIGPSIDEEPIYCEIPSPNKRPLPPPPLSSNRSSGLRASLR